MRTVLFWKRTDVIVQLLAIVIPFVCGIIDGQLWYGIFAYFTAGIVQLISVIINRSFLDKFLRKPGRTECEWATAVLIGLFLVSLLIHEIASIYFWGLLVLAPVLSIVYLVVCWKEMDFVSSIVSRRELL